MFYIPDEFSYIPYGQPTSKGGEHIDFLKYFGSVYVPMQIYSII